MRQFAASPIELFRSLYANAGLIRALAVRDVLGRYRGSALGLAWSFLQPLMMLAIYTFVFSGIFNARWNGAPEDASSGFALTLFAGLIAFNVFSEALTRASSLIVLNANYVKKVVFPLEILSVVSMCSAVFHLLVSLVILLGAEFLIFGQVPWTAMLFPLVLFPLIFLSLGCSWFISALAVYVRDVAPLAAMATSVLLFLSAVFFPLSAVPEPYRAMLSANPLSSLVEASRQLLVLGTVPEAAPLALVWLAALAAMGFGFVWFQRTRRGFSDVL